MAYIYFHKQTGAFQFVGVEAQEFEWNDRFEVADATVNDIYQLEDGVPVFVRSVTQDEIDSAAAAHDAFISTQYARQRAGEYPPITDYIDGVVKGDQSQIDAYIAACQAVKAKYPKPE